jgi:hypothetical protein
VHNHAVTNADLIAMQRAVQRSWTVDSHWHIGDLAWQRPALQDHTVKMWPDADGEVVAWAWLTPPGRLELHVPPRLIPAVLRWFDETADTVEQTVTAMDTDAALIGDLQDSGYHEVDEPYFRHCIRELDGDLSAPTLPDGYRVRVTRPGEMAERAAVHRAAWRPKWLGRLQVPPVDLGDGESGMTAERYRMIADTWPYRGLGAAVSLACLRAMRDAGAALAVVCPRGDAAYPVPRELYHRIGFRDAGRTVTYRRAA